MTPMQAEFETPGLDPSCGASYTKHTLNVENKQTNTKRAAARQLGIVPWWWDGGDAAPRSVSMQKDKDKKPVVLTQRAGEQEDPLKMVQLEDKTIATRKKIKDFGGGPSQRLRLIRDSQSISQDTDSFR